MEGHTVRTFDGDILNLRMRVLAMGGLAIDQVQRAVQALVRDDDDAGRGVIARGAQITAYAQSIDEEIIGLIARRQPMASDLRAIMGIGRRWASDLERVGNVRRARSPASRSSCTARPRPCRCTSSTTTSARCRASRSRCCAMR